MIIGLGHRSRVGKDTAARILIDLLGTKSNGIRVAQRVAFADHLKDICFRTWQHVGLLPRHYYEDQPETRHVKLPLIGLTPVELWVAVGNQMRFIDPDCWIRPVMAKAKQSEVTIVPDVRYENEVKAIQQAGGVVIKITRKSAPLLNTVADNALQGWDGWDDEIPNDEDTSNFRDLLAGLLHLHSLAT